MRFRDEFVSREERYALGIEEVSGRHYASIPVSTGLVDYEECYGLSAEFYMRLIADRIAAKAFVEECRMRRHDDLLMQRPGWNRGVPT